MNTTLILIGIGCIIGGIIGGGVKLVQVELSPVTSLWRQLLLGCFGIILVISGVTDGTPAAGPAPGQAKVIASGRHVDLSSNVAFGTGPDAPQAPTNAGSPDFIIPDSSTRRLTASDVAGLSPWQLRIARDEIFARHGRRFRTAELASYFSQKSWYRPVSDEVSLTALEQANVALIERYEKTGG